MTELPGAEAALAATPGATLAAAREASGLSVVQVAEQMRISPRQVEAIEADRYGELPGAVFVRGFVRNYARLLKLDPVPLLHALEPALGGDVPLRAHEIAGTLPETVRRSHHSRLWLVVFALVAALAAAAAMYDWWRGRSSADAVIGAGGTAGTPALPPLPATGAGAPSQELVPLSPERLTDVPAANRPAPAPQSTEAGASAEAGAAAEPGAAAPAIQSAQPAQAAPPVQAEEPAEPAAAARLELEVLAPTWLELRDDSGTVQFSGTVPGGTQRSFELDPPVEVVVGNASGVRITYNGKPFDVASHATRNIARFRLE